MNPTTNPTMQALTCPKCHGTMRVYERNGVAVDQCGDCRGIFLDRGELERLTDAETAVRTAAPRLTDPVASYGAFDDRSSLQGRDGTHGRRNRGGFLSDLFD